MQRDSIGLNTDLAELPRTFEPRADPRSLQRVQNFCRKKVDAPTSFISRVAIRIQANMIKSSSGPVAVYTLAGSNTARPLPDWLQRKRRRSLKHDPEFAHRVELLQDYSFEEASVCTRVSEDGEWVVSTGMVFFFFALELCLRF